MRANDARQLSPDAQEALRRRVVAAVQNGMAQAEAARVFGVARSTVAKWMAAVRRGGEGALAAKKRGRKGGSRLAGWQAGQVVRAITDRCPDQLKLPFALWTREAVQQLIAERFGLRVSVWTVGRYLKRWGLTPQKPLRRAFEQDPQAVRTWLAEEYPAIAREARQVGAEIHWGDEMGIRSDHQSGTTYGRRGQTPVVPGTGRRFSCQMISTVTNRGTLRFMVFRGAFRAPVLLAFLRRLLRSVDRPVFLILDRHPVHKSAAARHFVERHAKRLRLFFLPPYSPELNPDELLNHDVKANAVGRRRAGTASELETNVRGYLHSTQRRPDIVRAFFEEEHVRYAAQEM